MGQSVDIRNTQQLVTAAEAFVAALSAQVPGQRFDEFFHADTLRHACWAALERALEAYADPGRVPLARALLDGQVLADPAVIGELLRLFLPDQHPDYAAVARRWAGALGADFHNDLAILAGEAERVFTLLADELHQFAELRLALGQIAQDRLAAAWDDAPLTAESDLSRLLDAALVAGPETLSLQVRHLLALAAARPSDNDPAPALALEALTRLATHLDRPALRALWEALPSCAACEDPGLALRLLGHIVPYAARAELIDDPLAVVRTQIVRAGDRLDPAVSAAVLIALAPHLEASAVSATGSFPQRVLAAVGRIGDPAARVRALGALLPTLPADLRPQAIVAALETATAQITNEFARVEALSGLAPHLPPEGRSRLLSLAAQIAAPEARALLLGRILPQVSAALQPEALRGALEAIAQIAKGDTRASALVDLAPAVQALGSLQQYPAELRQALDLILAIERPGDRALAFAALAPALAPELLSEALHATREIADGAACAEALSRLAPWLPPDLQVAAFGIAQEVRPAQARVTALAAIAPYLSPNARRQALADALAVALAIDEHYTRVVALADLAPQLADDLRARALLEALTAARSIPNEAERGRALVFLAPHLLETQLADALADAYTIRDPLERTPALSALLPRLPEAPRRAVAEDLIATARTAPLPADIASILAAIAPVLPAELIGAALDLAEQIPAPIDRMHVLAALLPRDPLRLYGPALGTAGAIYSGYQRASALLDLLPFTPAGARQPILDEVLEAALDAEDDYDRASALAHLGPYLSAQAAAQHQQQDALRLALGACLRVADPVGRARLLGQLAPVWVSLLTPAQSYALWGDVVAFERHQPALQMTGDLAALAPVLEHMGAPRAVETVVSALLKSLGLGE